MQPPQTSPPKSLSASINRRTTRSTLLSADQLPPDARTTSHSLPPPTSAASTSSLGSRHPLSISQLSSPADEERTAAGSTASTGTSAQQRFLPPPINGFHRPSSSHSAQQLPSINIPPNPYATYHEPFSAHHLSRLIGSSGAASPLTPGFLQSLDERGLRSPAPPLTASGQFQPQFYHSGALPGIQVGEFGTLEERILRSPAPPLTPHYLSHTRQYVSPPTYLDARDTRGRPFYSSPLTEQHPQAGSSTFILVTNPPTSPLRVPGSYPVGPPLLPPPVSAHSTASTSTARSSPLYIPPPLRFNYSQSPPDGLPDAPHAMPPRKQLNVSGSGSNVVTPSTPMSSSVGSSRRKLSGVGVKGNGWTVENTYDSLGQKKEVVVIQDSESPSRMPKKRTRAQVAAEAAQLNGSGLNGSVNGTATVASSSQGSTKKRKVDEGSEAGSIKKAKGKPSIASSYASQQQVYAAPKPHVAPAPAPAAGQVPWDDAEGHYVIKPDDVVAGRYKIIRLLGQGTFGKVVEARHIESRRKVAIKIIRAVQKYRDASKIEIRVLETLRRHDPTNENKCIHLEEYFDFRNHPCLVSELYGMSVFDFLKQNSFQPFPEKHIQDFARSLLKSVDFLHRLRLVHTDLKPENILLVSNEARLNGPRVRGAKSKSILRNTDIRLIDFGSATFEDEYHSSVVSTRHYRAPEIILGLGWSYPCDVFSIGCILVEFFTGDALFQTHDNLEHLAMMEVIMGKMPVRMIERGRAKKPEFFRGAKIDYPNATVSRSSRKYVRGLKKLSEIISPTSNHNKLFLDLIVRMLDFDPDTRMQVSQALRHPYFKEVIPEPP